MAEGVAQLAAMAPAGHPATPEEIADAIVYLASEKFHDSGIHEVMHSGDSAVHDRQDVDGMRMPFVRLRISPIKQHCRLIVGSGRHGAPCRVFHLRAAPCKNFDDAIPPLIPLR